MEWVYFHLVRPKTLVLGQKVDSAALTTSLPTPTPVPPTPTPVPTPLASPTPQAVQSATAKTEKPSPTPVLQPIFTSEQINGFIDRFAGQYGVSPHVLRHIAVCESGFDPEAYYVGYAGLYQFGSVTWKNVRVKMGEDPDVELRYNAEEAVQTAAYSLSLGNTKIWPNCAP